MPLVPCGSVWHTSKPLSGESASPCARVAPQQAPSRGMDTLGGGRRVAKAASARLALARRLVIGIKGITHSKIQARQAHLDNLFALASASHADLAFVYLSFLKGKYRYRLSLPFRQISRDISQYIHTLIHRTLGKYRNIYRIFSFHDITMYHSRVALAIYSAVSVAASRQSDATTRDALHRTY